METAKRPADGPQEHVFDPWSGVVLIDTYSPYYTGRPHCDFRHSGRVLPRAVYQVRHPDVYDGSWRQACPKHLSDAVTHVSGLVSRDGRIALTGE